MSCRQPLTEEEFTWSDVILRSILSRDGTQSAPLVIDKQQVFLIQSQFSTGIDGVQGDRNAMALFNLMWSPSLNWDGSSN